MTAPGALEDVWRYAQAHRAGLVAGSSAAMLLVPCLVLLIVTTFEVKLLGKRRTEARFAREGFDGAWAQFRRRFGLREYLQLRAAYLGVMKNSVPGAIGAALFRIVETTWLVILAISSVGFARAAWSWMRGYFG